MTCPKVVVVGASAGGLEAVTLVLRSLPADFPAAVFIVIHRGADGPAILPLLLSRESRLPIRIPVQAEPIRAGTVYLAPLDRHLLIEDSTVRATHGPRQHGFRPAVDPLFISAAAAHGDCAAGVILSGALEDGTAGLLAIKRRGGTAVVQDPEEALVPSMPLSALRDVEVDAVLPASEIGPYLVELTRRPAVPNGQATRATKTMGKVESTPHPAGDRKLTPFTCPDCGGALWEVEDGPLNQYECHVGHRYGVEALQALGDHRTENILWAAVRALQEQAAVKRRMAARADNRGIDKMARRWQDDAAQSQERADQIRGLIEAMNGGDAEEVAGNGNGRQRHAAADSKRRRTAVVKSTRRPSAPRRPRRSARRG